MHNLLYELESRTKCRLYLSTRSHISGINPMETLPLFRTYIIYFLMNISFVMLLAGMFNILYKKH